MKIEFEELLNIKDLERINVESIIYYKEVQDFCLLPYKNHIKGCPNYGKEGCPPNAPFFKEILKTYEHNFIYLLYAYFNFGKYKSLRRIDWERRNVDYSEGLLNSVLYWQNSVKSIIKEEIKLIIRKNPLDKIYVLSSGSGFTDKFFEKIQGKVYSMEAVGINVFSTLKKNNIRFDVFPTDEIILVNLLLSNKKINIGYNKKQEYIGVSNLLS